MYRSAPLLLALAGAPLLPACADHPAPTGVALDGIPAGEAASPDGRWTAAVTAGGALRVESGSEGHAPRHDDRDVLPELAWSPDSRLLAYPRLRDGAETELMVLDLTGEAPAAALIAWPCSSDRPAFSPDGRRLAFVSGCTGVASLWAVEVAAGAGSAVQLTNVGVERVPHPPGQPPEGFIPVPSAGGLTWGADGLRWTAGGQDWTVSPP